MEPTGLSRLLRGISAPIGRALGKPEVRASRAFRGVQEVLSYQPQEEILRKVMAFVASSEIPGDYLEFGVGGPSFLGAYRYAELHELHDMRFYAFDSFQGMPPPRGLDADKYQPHEEGDFLYELDTFTRSLRDNGVDENRVEIVPGWYDDVLTDDLKRSLPLKTAAVVSADCGLYESTSLVLDFVTEFIQDGTIILFGDWFSYRGSPERGQQRAFAEWRGRHPELGTSEFHKFGWHGISFVIHRS